MCLRMCLSVNGCGNRWSVEIAGSEQTRYAIDIDYIGMWTRVYMTVVKAGNVRESESTRIDVKEEGVSAERDAKVRKEHSQVVSSSLGHIRDKGGYVTHSYATDAFHSHQRLVNANQNRPHWTWLLHLRPQLERELGRCGKSADDGGMKCWWPCC